MVSSSTSENATRPPSTIPTDPSFWPPRNPRKEFDWDTPTNVAYQIPDTNLFTTTFEYARGKLDYTYHKNPTLTRQAYQDMVLSRILEADKSLTSTRSTSSSLSSTTSLSDQDYTTEEQPERRKRPFIVFSAGPMGVGKSFVLSQLHQRNLFPLSRFIKIDPDMLKSELPEIAGYLQYGPDSAATKLHRESTQMADVLFEHSLATQRNILVDGSLRDVDWYTRLFRRLRTDFPQYVLSILYVSAPSETIKERARQRAVKSGRAVPEDLLQASIDRVPLSVAALAPLTDFTFEISNDDDAPMTLKRWSTETTTTHGDDGESGGSAIPPTEEMTWEDFRQVWEKDHRRCRHLLSQEEEEHVITIHSQMAAAYNCPTMQQTEIKSAKEIWGRAYPSFCPRCTIWADEQCMSSFTCFV